ncbi:MAG: peptidylprolyl isomerase [Proteobacteria bacterium]|nr:peptidylprolyl isomerase [Pseudomonadota bacterium]
MFLVLTLVVAAWGCKNETSSAEKKQVQPKATTSPKAASSPKSSPSKTVKAPDKFSVKLETTKEDIIIDVHREWGPRGADRFYNLVKSGYYENVAFFRVIKGFMAQTGISGNPETNAEWRSKWILDDPVIKSNLQGMVSFATSGPNRRTTQFFINFGDNNRLDSMGFAPFGQVRDIKKVELIYDGYGEGAPRGKGPSQKRIQKEGNSYLKAEFPKLDYIRAARIID